MGVSLLYSLYSAIGLTAKSKIICVYYSCLLRGSSSFAVTFYFGSELIRGESTTHILCWREMWVRWMRLGKEMFFVSWVSHGAGVYIVII